MERLCKRGSPLWGSDAIGTCAPHIITSLVVWLVSPPPRLPVTWGSFREKRKGQRVYMPRSFLFLNHFLRATDFFFFVLTGCIINFRSPSFHETLVIPCFVVAAPTTCFFSVAAMQPGCFGLRSLRAHHRFPNSLLSVTSPRLGPQHRWLEMNDLFFFFSFFFSLSSFSLFIFFVSLLLLFSRSPWLFFCLVDSGSFRCLLVTMAFLCNWLHHHIHNRGSV
jgi:hypothetical protein